MDGNPIPLPKPEHCVSRFIRGLPHRVGLHFSVQVANRAGQREKAVACAVADLYTKCAATAVVWPECTKWLETLHPARVPGSGRRERLRRRCTDPRPAIRLREGGRVSLSADSGWQTLV